MIDENRQDQAIAFILGELPPAEAAAFDADVERDFELKQFVRELGESTAALAAALPPEYPPTSLRRKIVRTLPRDGAAEDELNWLSPAWGIVAFSLAIAFVLTLVDDVHFRARAAYAQSQAVTLHSQLAALDAQVADLRRQSDAARQQIADLQSRNELGSVRIASLASQTPPLAKADVVVVWDAEKQQGVIKLAHLPKAAPGKDYQLWVIDPKYAAPVSAGVLSVADDGTVLLSFKPDQPVSAPDKFAISVEKAGGVPKAAGPIVFAGSL